MKGTIYLWVLAAVLSGHLSDCLGSQLRVFLSSVFVHGADNRWRHCRGRGGTYYDCALPKRESRLGGRVLTSFLQRVLRHVRPIGRAKNESVFVGRSS
jgi:hypothetical protein